MALIDQYNLQYLHTLLRQRTQIAIESAAYNVLNEDPGSANHANRIVWANTVLNNPEKMMNLEMAMVVQNPTIEAEGDNAADSDIQFVVNGLVDYFANAIASGAIKFD
jgi:glucose-6-phosphate isomerase